MVLLLGDAAAPHEQTLSAYKRLQEAAQTHASVGAVRYTEGASTRLTVNLFDARSDLPLAGMIRITEVESGAALLLPELVKREMNWFAMPAQATTVDVPMTALKIEAMHGLETEIVERVLDLTNKENSTIKLPLSRFYDAQAHGLRSGNTHLHLMGLTQEEVKRYLRVVPEADGLDLVFLSYLRRIPDEETYISNEVVANNLTSSGLGWLPTIDVLRATGQEHRHNFAANAEGYGHVMFLDILRLVQPVSIGPGIMKKGTDGLPLQAGIVQAREQGATVIWCHSTFGFEDIPNWIAGTLDAQNIYDGAWSENSYDAPFGSYSDTFYRYLNLGMEVPFSTGTDWFIYDFSRVYVPITGEMTSKQWLTALSSGRSYITNGTFLEFQVSGKNIGDTIFMERPGDVEVTGRALGRQDFNRVEVVYNGEIVRTQNSEPTGSHFEAVLEFELNVEEPGWIALRIPTDGGKNLFAKPLFAHTSPIYIEVEGNRIFQRHVAKELISEIRQNIEAIRTNAAFADNEERARVLRVHRAGIEALQDRLRSNQ